MAKHDCGAWNNADGHAGVPRHHAERAVGTDRRRAGAPRRGDRPDAADRRRRRPTGPKPQAPLAPAATAAPTVAGVAMVEQTLSATHGNVERLRRR